MRHPEARISEILTDPTIPSGQEWTSIWALASLLNKATSVRFKSVANGVVLCMISPRPGTGIPTHVAPLTTSEAAPLLEIVKRRQSLRCNNPILLALDRIHACIHHGLALWASNKRLKAFHPAHWMDFSPAITFINHIIPPHPYLIACARH